MSFDPYLEWLGIAEGRRPPTHYELLGLKPFESHPPAMDDAILARAALVRKYQVGRREEDAQRLLEELQQAYGCLSDPARKAAYDSSLRGATTLVDDPTNETRDEDNDAGIPVRPLYDDRDFLLDPVPPVLPQPAMRPIVTPVPIPRPNPVLGSSPPLAPPRLVAVPAEASGQASTVEETSGFGMPRAMQAALAVAAAVVVLFLISQMFSSTDTSTSVPAEGDVASVETLSATVTQPEVETKPAAMPPTPSAPVIPNLSPIAPQQINEGRELMLKATTTNAPPAGKSWAFRLEPGAPAGAKLDSATGILTWTPTEEQGPGPGPYSIGIVAFDPTAPELRSTTSFTVDVKEVNRPPALATIARQEAEVGKPLEVKLIATDADLPAQQLSFRLQSSTAQGATINDAQRVFQWTPSTTDAGKTHIVAVEVLDSGLGSLSSVQRFYIDVKTSVSGPTPAAPTAPQTPAGSLLVSEDFDRTTDKIREFSSPSIQTNVIDGKYVMRRVGDDTRTVGIGGPTFEQVAGDFSCEVVGRIIGSGRGLSLWGLRIEVTAPSGSITLRPTINIDGRFSGVGSSVVHQAIKAGAEWNTLTMQFRGQQVDVFVNGTKIVDNHQATQVISPARVSLYIVGTPGTTAEFDRVRIWSGAGPGASSAPAPAAPALPRLTNSIGMEFVQIPAGEFLMGASSSDRNARPEERPQHKVRITKPFYMGVCEVTQEEFETVTRTNPSWYTDKPRKVPYFNFLGERLGENTVTPLVAPQPQFPVENVTMQHVQNFCTRLAARPAEKKAGRKYRLPTEAEWEYACRAGSTGEYSTAAITMNQNRNEPTIVGKMPPNAWGLCDMHGNVAELCQDRYDETYYTKSPTDDPLNKVGRELVTRGGHWLRRDDCRSSARVAMKADEPESFVGFRVVCEAP